MTAPSHEIANDPGAKISASVMLVMGAVIVTGMLGALRVSPLLAVSTLLVTWLLGREARRAAISRSPSEAFPEFPASLRATVDRAMSELPAGDARRLLSDCLAQARPLLAPHEGALDDRQENATRENVLSLVDACCYTALELARLDAASAARDPAAGSQATNQTAAARDLLVKRLSGAATALASLYVAGVMHGSPASELVAQLADEINADASARRAAANEISALLDDGEQPSSPEQTRG
jgi:hypothetical protein